MLECFCGVVDGVNDREGAVSENAGDIHDGCAGLGFEMIQEPNDEMHRSRNINGDFLICFIEREIVDVERALDACVVDEAVDFGVFTYDFFAEGRDGGDVACVEDIVDCSVAEFLGSFFEFGFGAADEDDFFAVGDEPLGFCFAEATCAASNESTLEVQGLRRHFSGYKWVRR